MSIRKIMSEELLSGKVMYVTFYTTQCNGTIKYCDDIYIYIHSLYHIYAGIM